MRRMPSLPLLLILALTIPVISASTSSADEPQPQSTQPRSDVVTPDQAKAPAPRPLMPEEAAIQQILAEGQAQVAELLASTQADPSRMEQVQREIVRVKTENRILFLQTLLDFARQRGDERGLQEAQAALEVVLHPPVSAPVPNGRELTDAKAREVQK